MMFEKMDATEEMLRNLMKERADEFNELNKSLTRLEQAFLTDKEAFASLFKNLSVGRKKGNEAASSVRNKVAELTSKTQTAKEKCNTLLDMQKDMQAIRKIMNEQAIATIGPTFANIQNEIPEIAESLQDIETQLQTAGNMLIRLAMAQIGANTPSFLEAFTLLRKSFDEFAEKTAITLVAIRTIESLVLGAYAEIFRSYRESIGKKVRWPNRS